MDSRKDNGDFGLGLRVSHLQLSPLTEGRLRDFRLNSIAELLSAIDGALVSRETVGLKAWRDILNAVDELKDLTDSEGRIDWLAYSEMRPVVRDRCVFTARELFLLDASERARPIGALHLRKAINGLLKSGIHTVGELVDRAFEGIGKVQGSGTVANAEIKSSLSALGRTVEPDGMVHWERFAELKGFPLLPARPVVGSRPNVTALLPRLCDTIAREQFSERERSIMQRRFLVASESQETLQALGDVYGISRERIRQLEAKCLAAIRKPIFEGDYAGLGFRLRDAVSKLFHDAREHFESLGLPAWRESEWFGELEQIWSAAPGSLRRNARLMPALLGYEKVNLDSSWLEPLLVSEIVPKTERTRTGKQVDLIHTILQNHNGGLDAFGIAKELNSKGKAKQRVQPDEIPVLVDLCSTAERAGELFRMKLVHLKGRAEQIVRILAEHGEPMHHNDLFRELNRRLPKEKRLASKENLVNQMSPDPRLEPIGKSGKWTLAEWGLETRPLPDLIEEVLTEAGEAMPLEEIATKVLEKRPGSEKSIPMILEMNPERFSKVGHRIFALKVWGEGRSDTDWWGTDAVAAFVEDYFKNRKADTVEFRELRTAFMKETGFSDRSARGILAFHPIVDVLRPDDHSRFARIRADWRTFKRTRKRTNDRPLKADMIADEAVALLEAAPSGELPLIQIVQALEEKLNVVRPSVYAAVSQSEDIESVAVEGSAFKVCKLAGRNRPKFPGLKKINNTEWRSECQRAVEKLTLESVDIGLFMLGRQFDAALKSLLGAAGKDVSKPVSQHDLKTLNNRIEWAVRHGVFTDRATLNLLRIERNERGHQPPTADEREAILKFAPYLAELYIDYLILVENKIVEFA